MKRFILSLILTGLVACVDSDDGHIMEQLPDPAGDVETAEDPTEPAPEPAERQPTRMTVQQIARSIPVVTGGIEWIEDFGQGPVNILATLAATLGAPDYKLRTEENMEPSLIIAKFMQDAAGRICVRWVDKELTAPLAERTLIGHDPRESLDPAQVKDNLRRLQLRFFSRYVAPDDDDTIADLVELFDTASSGASAGKGAQDGWLAVCLALMTDPEFVIY